MLTDEERGQIEAEIVKRIWRFESELRAAYADSTWIDNDIYHSDRRPNAGKLMTREEKIRLALTGISSWGDE